MPSNTFESVAEVSVTLLLSIVSFPLSLKTANCAVTSFPSASLTIGVPITFTAYSPAFVPVTSADMPVTV